MPNRMKKPKIVEPKLTVNAREIAKKRYLRTDLKGKTLETPGEMLWRVAYNMAKAEVEWPFGDAQGKGPTNGSVVMKVATQFYERMVNFKMVCAGKAMFEAGNPGGTGQLSSCFVLPVEDSIDKIFKTLGEAAVVHKNNGGTGFNFSKIRPHGDKVRNVPKASSGPVDFLRAYSAALSQILQGAKRQGANIGILNIDHPDIEEFISLKDQDGVIKNFNVSVGVTDSFMETVERDGMWELRNPRTKELVKKVKARRLFEMIADQAWKTGDPGLAFLDTMERGNTVPSFGKLDATNPCGEIALFPYESCNLTSIDLARHIRKIPVQSGSSRLPEFTKDDKAGLKSVPASSKDKWEVDWDDLGETVKLGVRFLDNMIEVNSYPIAEIEQTVKNGNRRIGLGVMGFAHVLYRMGIPYDNQKAVILADKYSKFIYKKAAEASADLAEERGNFSNWDLSIYPAKGQPMRNCAVTMIAPTGTISLLANTSSGIEPVFSLVTMRRTFYEDDNTNKSTKELVVVDPVFEEYLKSEIKNSKKRSEVLSKVAKGDLSDLSKKAQKVFVTTHKILPEWHVKIQAAWQKNFDNSISKTVNFPNSASVEDVKDAYMQAWKLGCKGITIYRDGSKEDQVLNVSNGNDFPAQEYCSECGGRLEKAEGCSKCYDCGWSKCG